MGIGENRNLAIPKCVNSIGDAPVQIMMEDLEIEAFDSFLDETEPRDALDFADEFDDVRYEDLDEEDYSQLF